MNLPTYLKTDTEGGFCMEYKTHRSPRRRGNKESSSFATAIIVLISIVLIALIIVFSPLGAMIQDSVIRPVFSCFGRNPDDEKIVSALQSHDEAVPSQTPEPTEPPTEKSIITINAMPFYILQMGVYTDQNEAIKYGEEIELFGAGGNVYHDGSVYRVFAAAYLDEKSVLTVQTQIRKDGFEATPYVTDRTGIRITLNGDSDAIRIVSESIPLISSVPSSLCEMSLAFDKQETTDAAVINELGRLSETCDEKIEELQRIQSQSVKPIVGLLEKYQSSISTFLHEHGTMNMRIQSNELKHLQLSIIIDYILFFQQE